MSGRPGRAIAFAVLAFTFAAPARVAPAQTPASPPSGPLHRAVGAPEWLSLRLEQRTRVEHLQNDFRVSAAGKDETALVLRTLLAAEVRIQQLAASVELADSRAYANDQTPLNTTIIDAVDVLQANLAWRQANGFRRGDQLSVTAGA